MKAQTTWEGRAYEYHRGRWIDQETGAIAPVCVQEKLDALCPREESVGRELLRDAARAREDGRLARAESLIRRFLKTHPHDQGARSFLCSVLRERGQPALALLEAIPMKGLPGPMLRTTRAAAWCDLGEWKRARDEIALAIASGHPREPHTMRVLKRIRSVRPDLA